MKAKPNYTFCKQIGNRIKSYRQRLQFTQAQVALAANISDSELRRIEQGKIACTIDILYAIALALGVSFHELTDIDLSTKNDESLYKNLNTS